MIKHHPTPEMLTDYASGSLRLSHALCVAAHIEQCEKCQRQVGQLESLGAQLFESQTPNVKQSNDTLKSKVFDLIEQLPSDNAITVAESRPNVCSDGYRVPRTLRQFINSHYGELQWAALSPSIKFTTLLKDKDGSQIALSRVKAGGKMPHHRHTGEELTVVLEGAFSDESGLYRKGDFVSRDNRHKHKPMVTKDAECICLMVLDAPIEFTGLLSRLLNPLVKRNHAAG